MSIAEKLTTIAENQQKVYDKGLADGKAQGGNGDISWDVVQDNGNRTMYMYGFAYWSMRECNPKYKIVPTGTYFQNAFQGCLNLEEVDWTKFDLSQCGSFYNTFYNCFALKSIDIDLRPTATTATVFNNTFRSCMALKKIQKIVPKVTHTWTDCFYKCYELEDVTFGEYLIGNDISFADCSKLSKDSILSILNALSLETNSNKTLTLNKTAVNTAFDFDIDDPDTYDYLSNGFLITAGVIPNWTIMVGDTKLWQ